MASYPRIDADLFAESLIKVLTDFAGATAETLERECDSVSKEALKKLKEDSPKDTGEYAKGWRRMKNKAGDGFEYTLYNAKWAGRTHLLEKGHVVKPGPKHPGKLTRVKGIEHIKPVEEWAQQELIARIERSL